MNLHKLILTKNDCYKKNQWITPKGIMVHSTGANNPTLKRYVGPDDGLLGVNVNNNNWNMGGVGACVHAFIGKLKDGTIATYQTLPWTMRGWHCAGSGNNNLISFEICEDGLRDKIYFGQVYAEAVELCVYLCKEFKLSPDSIICHCEGYKKGVASNHADVMHWFKLHNKTMNDFRNDVKKGLENKPLLTSANDITWELNHSYFPITETKKFVDELEQAKNSNSSLYWGFYKLVNKIKA